MSRAPNCCPVCGASNNDRWIKIDESNKGFSIAKALFGGFLFGHYGLLGGFLGSKKETYFCKRCGFKHEYDG